MTVLLKSGKFQESTSGFSYRNELKLIGAWDALKNSQIERYGLSLHVLLEDYRPQSKDIQIWFTTK